MADPTPLVTVAVTCFNHERFVVECLESVRAQTYPNVQLIIADDCSTDSSVQIIRDWVHESGVECTLVLHDTNQGICKTRNEVLTHVRGTYLSTIAADDAWLPDKLALEVERLEELPPSVGVLYADARLIDEEGRPFSEETFIENLRRFSTVPEGDVFETLLDANFVPAMTTMVRARCYEVVGRYDETLAYEDWDMWLRIAREFEFAYLPRVVALYRKHSRSLSNTLGSRFWETDMRIFLKHVGHSDEWDAILWDRIAHIAYRLDDPQAREYVRAYRRAAGWRALPLWSLSALGVPYRRVAPFKRVARRLTRRAPALQAGTPTSL